MNDQTHPELPVFDSYCTRKRCAEMGIPQHPENFHNYDVDFNADFTIHYKEYQKRWDAFFDGMLDNVMENSDIPYPLEYDNDEDTLQEFQIWFTMQIIHKFYGLDPA
jgi:hypothetical protein